MVRRLRNQVFKVELTILSESQKVCNQQEAQKHALQIEVHMMPWLQ